MELKRILARDSRSASEEAMARYGRDVLIISSNRVNGQTELIIAIDAAPERSESAGRQGQSATAAPARRPQAAAPDTDTAPANTFEELLFAQSARQHAAVGAPQPAAAPPSWTPAAPVPSTAAPSQQLASQYDAMRGSEIVALLKEELGAIRQEIRLHQQLGLQQLDVLTPSLQPLMDELVERGLPPGLREHITNAWKTVSDPIEALGRLETELTRILPAAQAPIHLQGVHVLCGPSGSGKSLACAKLAHLASEALGADAIAWISFADHRAGAWSQTQMLATPSGVATFRAGNVDGLKLLLDELSHLKLILIDTTGVDFDRQLTTVREIAPEAKTHMVLPMDATLTSIKRALRHADQLTSVVLSKMDESYAPWAMIYGLSQRQVRVAWINDSERLHTPMQVYAPQTLAEKALNTLGQTDDESTGDEHSAKTLRLNDMHEVPDLTDTLEPFAQPEPTLVPDSSRVAASAPPASGYGASQFGRIHMVG